jgi:preprotein translocase subunit SecY
MASLFNSDAAGILGFLDIFGGGASSRLSVLRSGIMPFITSSIVFQILTLRFLTSRNCNAKASTGRRKWLSGPRWAAIGLTVIQSSVAARALCRSV